MGIGHWLMLRPVMDWVSRRLGLSENETETRQVHDRIRRPSQAGQSESWLSSGAPSDTHIEQRSGSSIASTSMPELESSESASATPPLPNNRDHIGKPLISAGHAPGPSDQAEAPDDKQCDVIEHLLARRTVPYLATTHPTTRFDLEIEGIEGELESALQRARRAAYCRDGGPSAERLNVEAVVTDLGVEAAVAFGRALSVGEMLTNPFLRDRARRLLASAVQRGWLKQDVDL